jgi:hypothetical protein
MRWYIGEAARGQSSSSQVKLHSTAEIPRVGRVVISKRIIVYEDNPCFASHCWDWHADCSSALKEEVPKAVPGPTFPAPRKA